MARVLIVDDDPAVMATLKRMLEHDGHAVEQADSGITALERALASPPDAILLDLRMPGMGGLEFLQKLRADDRLKATPVGVLTGDYFLRDQVAAEIESLGAIVRYKPLWLKELKELTGELLGRIPLRE